MIALRRIGVVFVAAAAFIVAVALVAPPPARAAAPWTETSRTRVRALEHPTLEQRLERLTPSADSGFAFVAFGDQRAIADREWPAMMRHIGRLAARDARLLFMIDTGDIVENGSHADQFATMQDILKPAQSLPYLVAVGNHEVDNNRGMRARANLARCLGALDARFAPARMYYRKDVGPLRIFFLDTNDLVYTDSMEIGASAARAARSRGRAQMAWLARELSQPERDGQATVVVMHHPFVQSSAKHRAQAIALWEFESAGRRLVDAFLDGGVDLVLAGHTHTYERFRVARADGRSLRLVNLSGRPRNSFLWFGAASRRARDMRGVEARVLRDAGWRLGALRVTQEEWMPASEEADQFARFDVSPAGAIRMTLGYLAGPAFERVRWGKPVEIYSNSTR